MIDCRQVAGYWIAITLSLILFNIGIALASFFTTYTREEWKILGVSVLGTSLLLLLLIPFLIRRNVRSRYREAFRSLPGMIFSCFFYFYGFSTVFLFHWIFSYVFLLFSIDFLTTFSISMDFLNFLISMDFLNVFFISLDFQWMFFQIIRDHDGWTDVFFTTMGFLQYFLLYLPEAEVRRKRCSGHCIAWIISALHFILGISITSFASDIRSKGWVVVGVVLVFTGMVSMITTAVHIYRSLREKTPPQTRYGSKYEV